MIARDLHDGPILICDLVERLGLENPIEEQGSATHKLGCTIVC